MKSSDSSYPSATASAPEQKTNGTDRQSTVWAKAEGVAAGLSTPVVAAPGKVRGRKKGSAQDQQDEQNDQLLAAADTTSTQTNTSSTSTDSEGDRRTSGYSTSDSISGTSSTSQSTASVNIASDDRPAASWAKQDTANVGGWGDSGLYGLLGGGLALGLSAGGGGGKSSGSGANPTDGGQPTTTVSIRASESAGIKGAKVFAVDATGTEVQIGTTDAAGHLSVDSTKVTDTLLLKGGTNIATGLPNTLEMVVYSEGFDKQVAINHITTLVAAVYEAAAGLLTLSAAEEAVKSHLGIASSVNLETYDPLDASVAGSNTALSYLKLDVQIATIVGSSALGEDFLLALAQHIADNENPASPLDLSSAEDLKAVLGTPSSSQVIEIQDVAANNAQILEQVSIKNVQTAYQAGLAPVILGLKNDTGESGTDHITTDPRLVVSGVNTGSTIEYSVDDITWTSEVIPSGEGDVTVRARLVYSNGNSSSYSDVSDTFTFHYVEPQKPTVLSLSLKTDTGISRTDHITSAAEIDVGGQLEGTYVEYSTDGKQTWQSQFQATDDGVYDVYARQTFIGHGSDEASALQHIQFTLDTQAQAGTAGLAANEEEALENDTGYIDSNDQKIDATFNDGITSNTLPVLSGKTEAGATSVSVEIDGQTYQVLPANLQADGTWTLTLTEALEDGTYRPVVTVVDKAGNISPATEMDAFTIDTTPPEAPQEGVETFALDTASDSGLQLDHITNIQRPVIKGTTEANAYVVVNIDEQNYSTVANDEGQWRITVTNPLSEGDYDAVVTVVDGAGNSTELEPYTFTVDLTPPSVDVQAHLLDEEEVDTGLYSDDGITNNNLPTIVGTVEFGTFVSAVLNGKRYAIAAEDGDWSFTVPEGEELDDGTYNVTIEYRDDAGNVVAPADVVSVPFTIDTEAPSLDEYGLVHEEGNDTGIDSEDGITNNNSPVFRGTVTLRDDDTVEPGLIVRVTIGDNDPFEAEVNEDGTWEVTAEGVEDGEYEPIIQVVDIAGNVSEELSVTLTIDTQAPDSTAELVHDEENDTGADSEDNITSNTSPTLQGETEPLAHVVLDINGNTYEADADENGMWSVQVEGLEAGEYTPTITVTDVAGNESAPIDGTPFTVVTGPDLSVGTAEFVHDEENDTGADAEDGLTANNSPTLVGTGTPGVTVRIDFGDGQVFEEPVDEDGNWTLTADGLADGEYAPIITMLDEQGNEGDPLDIELTFSVDTQAPTEATGELVHDEFNDSGADQDDNITNNTTPTISGETEAFAKVEVDVDGETYETTADENGVWEVTLNELVDGVKTPFITVTDLAGNVSEPIEGTSFTVLTSATLGVPDGGLTHDEDSDTGVSQDDNLTSTDSPTISGTGGSEGNTVRVTFEDGSTFDGEVDADGNWVVETSGLSDGEHTPTITFVDIAGNESEPFVGEVFTVDTQVPNDGQVALSTDSDSGEADDDGFTSETAPILTGTAEAGSKVIVEVDGTQYIVDEVDESGEWSVELNALSDGEYTPTINVIDKAGNETGAVDGATFVIDTEAPTEATAELMHDEFSDSGVDQEDNITNINAPTLMGETEAFAKVVVDVDGEIYETTADENGAWDIALVNLSEGEYTPLITVTDLAGNQSQPIEGTPFTVVTTIELDAPISGGLVHDEDNDTGINSEDNLTNNTSPTLTGEGIPGLTVRVDLDGVYFETEVNEDGTWELSVDGLTDGQYTPVITFLDVAGNESEPTEGESFEVDTEAPFDGDGALTVDSDNDTGAANDDGITSNTAPLMRGVAEVGTTVIVTLDDGTEYVFDGVDDSGTWEIGLSDLADGQYNPVITIRDAAGNETTVDGTPFVIDTEAPSEATGELVHDEENDTGSEQDDNITNNTSPLLAGDTDPLAFVTVTLDGVTYEPVQADEDGHWELQVQNLSEGEHTPSITVTDLAGNESESFEGTPFTVLTSAALGIPGGGLTHDEDNDTGADMADGLTNNSSPTLTGFGGTEGNIVRVTLDDGSTFDGEVDADGNWVVETSGLSDGQYTPTITFLDIAGNESDAFVSDTFTVDTQAPDDGEVALSTDSDTGTASDDGITSEAAPILTGTAEAGSKVVVEVDGTEYIIDEVDESGEWTVQLNALTDGEYTPTINVIDKAGNETGAVDGTPFVIDTEAPTEATGELVHDEVNDTGADSEDNITNNTSPTLSGDITDAENGTVTLLIHNQLTGDDIEIKDIPVDESGHWEYTLEDTLVDGEHTISIVATDVAGNVSESIAGASFTVLTSSALIAPDNGGLTHDADNDTGVLPDDNLTNYDSPTISGTGAPEGTTVRVSFADQDLVFEAEVNADGSWAVETSGLTDGDYTPTITFLDIAGNESEAFEGEMFTVDTLVPEDGAAVLSEDSDTGESSADGITSETAPILQGTAEAGSKVIVEVDGTEYVIEEVDESGEWQVQLNALTDGEYTPTVNVIDKAGNETGPVDGTSFVIDTEAPTDATAELLHDALNDTGFDPEDNITNNTSPTLSGETEALATVKLSIDGQDYETTADEDGLWSIKVSNLSDGDYTPILTIVDAAGNESAEIEGTPFTVDHTKPDAGIGELVHDEDNDTGISSDDNFTSNASPTLVGEAEEGATVLVTINGQVQETVADGGAWEVSFSDLPDGTWTPTISVTDTAGNVTVSQGTAFVLDTKVPDTSGITGGLVHDTFNDTGTSTTDSITQNSSPMLRGTAPALADVLVVVDGTEYPATANINGVWEVQLEGLGDDTYTPEITVVDLAGNQSTPVNGTSFTIVTEASGDASGELVHDAINDTGVDVEDGITSNSRPTLSGTADPGASVLIQLDATHSYTTQATTAGTWSFKLPTALPDGTYTPLVSVTDLAGNSSDPVEGAPIVIDTKVDTATGSLTHDATNDAGVSATDSITNNNLPQLSGRAEANAAVRVTLGSMVFDTVADEEGAWAVDVDQELANGRYTPMLEVTDAAGNKKTFTGEAFTVNLAAASDGINIGSHYVALSGENAAPTVIDLSGGIGHGKFEDYGGTLPAGLTLDTETGLITGKPTALGSTWISSTTTDTAGNEFTSYSQLVVTTGEKSIQGTVTYLTINNVNPDKPMTYIGTSGNNSMNVYRSVGDVILSGDGNDTFNMVDPGTKDEFLPMDFARLDGGNGVDTIKIYGAGTSIDFADFNNPDGAGKVMQHIEVVNLASREMDVTISVGDIFRMQSDVFDKNSVSKMVRFVSTKTGLGTATLDGFTQVGAGSDYQEDGSFTNIAAKAVYNKYTGTYSDATGDHLVTLLLHEGLAVS